MTAKRVTTLERLPARLEGVESQIQQLRSDMSVEFSAVRAEFASVRDDIRAGDEETRLQMRVLHAEVISRIALLSEETPRFRSAGRPRVKRKR